MFGSPDPQAIEIRRRFPTDSTPFRKGRSLVAREESNTQLAAPI